MGKIINQRVFMRSICPYKVLAYVGSLLLAILTSGCAAGPDYVQPPIAMPAHYKEAIKEWKPAQPQDEHERGAWWAIFNDAQLNALEARVNISNQTVAAAEAQYRQSLALTSQAQAGYFPTLSGSMDITSQRQGSGSLANTNTSSAVTHYNTGLNASWEADVWGNIRRQVESAKAGAQASAAQLAALRLSTQALLAQHYFQLRTLDKDQQLLDKTVVAYQQALKLTQSRYNSGVATISDIAQAQTQLKAAQAQALDNGISRAQQEHALAVLMGLPPASFALAPKVLLMKPPTIPLQVPSMLLERRPDIAQAERQMAAANAQIGVEMSAYFPAFSLSGSAGYAGHSFAHWLAQPNLLWSVGPQLAATLFDGGLRRAKTAAARASYEQSVALYRQSVLAALQEVEDNLVALRVLTTETAVQQQAVVAARLALKLALANYKAGTIAYTEVIVAQTASYTAEKTAADLAGRSMAAAVGLITALGGGWFNLAS